MEKIQYALFFISALCASCSKSEFIEPQPMQKVPLTVTVSVEQTKATIRDMKWEEGDKITVWVGSALSNPAYEGDVLQITDVQSGKFSGEITRPEQTDTYYMAYNASGFDRSADHKSPVFDIPAVQNSASQGATKAMLKGEFRGAITDVKVALKPATAKLQINVDKAVTCVQFSGMKQEELTASSKQISYTGEPTREIELVVPAMGFEEGYKIVYTDADGKKMYQSYGAGKNVDFSEGGKRTVNCQFVPFTISVKTVKAPMTSYSYYLAGDLSKANSMEPDKCEPGTAELVVEGISASLLAQMGLKVKEIGYYDNARHLNGWSGELEKGTQWNVYGNAPLRQGVYSIRPFAVITDADGGNEREIKADAPVQICVTGLPCKFNDPEQWEKDSTCSGSLEYQGGIPVFYNDDTSNRPKDFCVKSTQFLKIPGSAYTAAVTMRCVMFGPERSKAKIWIDSSDSFRHHDPSSDDGYVKYFDSCSNDFKHVEKDEYYENIGGDKPLVFDSSASSVNIYVWYDRKGVGIYKNKPGLYTSSVDVKYAQPAAR